VREDIGDLFVPLKTSALSRMFLVKWSETESGASKHHTVRPALWARASLSVEKLSTPLSSDSAARPLPGEPGSCIELYVINSLCRERALR